MIPKIVYLLCTLTSAACAFALTRGYLKTRTRLLLWSTLGFVGLAISNLLLFLDLVIYTDLDLSLWRMLANCAGVAIFLGGLIWDTD